MIRRFQIRHSRAIGIACLPLLLLPTACITGNEVAESMSPARSRRLADLDQAHELGIISDVEYEAKRRMILERD
jgi:hypothetical protein